MNELLPPPSMNATAVRALLQAGAPGEQAYGRCSDLSDSQIDRVIARVGSVEFADVALRLRPWPPWLNRVLFGHD